VTRKITYAEALREAQDQCLAAHREVFIMGLGVPDPKGIFGTTLGLQQKYGDQRVFDIPLSENALTGIALGAAITGMRPILTHQRVDFAVIAMEQLVNQAAKWHYMFGGAMRAPMVIRMIIGRGWGQGPQHSQSLQSWFAHVPGLKVVMPTTARDAKGLLVASVEDDNPVVFLEYRWLYGIEDEVPSEFYRTPLGKAQVLRNGTDVTIVGISYMTLEALRAAERLSEEGVSAEVIDLRTVRPWDVDTILRSVQKTGRLVVADTDWPSFGVASEIITTIVERAFAQLKSPPERVALVDCPSPTSSALAAYFYPRAGHVHLAAKKTLGMEQITDLLTLRPDERLDVPDRNFAGPF
jgi:acetoin:2,6-dichlorophenolindophenol oxidoreductase subunit beta